MDKFADASGDEMEVTTTVSVENQGEAGQSMNVREGRGLASQFDEVGFAMHPACCTAGFGSVQSTKKT